MDSVLKKTVVSLERALRYNPENVELMISLAEGYIRMGRLDVSTIDLCEKVLLRYPDNPLLLQAQAVAFVIEQTDQIDAGLAADKTPPPPEAIQSSIDILQEFATEIEDAATVWVTYVRLCLLAGLIEQALEGLHRLRGLHHEDFSPLKRSLDWVSKNFDPEKLDWAALVRLHDEIGEPGLGLRVLENAYDRATSQDRIGPELLRLYLAKYSPSDPGAVPETLRPRLFQVMLDYGDSATTGEWLRKASLFGWQINNYSKVYVEDLVRTGDLDSAFEILQRMGMDPEIKALLNTIANEFETHDRIDQAVTVLRYINSHDLVENDDPFQQEAELAQEMEHSLAELHLKNGRPAQALGKFVSALCAGEEPDPTILERIDEIMGAGTTADPAALMRLASYFRLHNDHPKTVYYLNHILDREPNHSEALEELQTLFNEILTSNPDNPELRIELGKLFLKMGKTEEAMAEFKTAAGSPATSERGNRMLAQTFLDSGLLHEALARLQECKVGSDDLQLLYDLHLKFMDDGDRGSALISLEMIARVQADFRDISTRIRSIEESTGGAALGGDPKMRELIGDMAIGRYRHLDKVGSGGMGVVHKVVDLRQQKVVAMKILRDGLAGSSKALDRFFREARIAASIHHRNIVEIYDYNISSLSGHSYICMEFVDGPSLREFIDQHYDQTISITIEFVTEMIYYATQLFDALEATHVKGIIHRDIKPDNIMVNTVGEVKITDFGIVHVDEATFTPTGAMLGTPRYMSPEQVIGGKLDGRSDIYSCGVLLYEVLTGAPPFTTGDISYQQVNKKPVEPRAVNPVVPQSINDFIMKCLEKNPDDRYSNAKEAKLILAEMLEGLGGCSKYESMTIAGDEVQPLASPLPQPQDPSQEAQRSLPPQQADPQAAQESDSVFGADSDLDLPGQSPQPRPEPAPPALDSDSALAGETDLDLPAQSPQPSTEPAPPAPELSAPEPSSTDNPFAHTDFDLPSDLD